MGTSAAHVLADQSEVFTFLANPRTYGISEPVVRVDTHGAAVFLAGKDAYKVKRAVLFPFLDFSTLEKRRAACEAEVRVDRPNAPDLYLGTVPVTRDSETLALGGSGEIMEWTVHMRRFDERLTLDHVAAAEGLSPELIGRLARTILASHARAPARDGARATASIRQYLEENRVAFEESPDLFPAPEAAALHRAAIRAFAEIRSLLLSRGDAGYVRRCHGDLHLRNVVLLDNEPTLFDAVEFSDEIATGDVLYDLAFLLMGLWEREVISPANLLLNRYLWESDEAHLSGLAALPLFPY